MNYRTDPIWMQAQQAFINPNAATADQRMLESIAAAVMMWTIERVGGAA